MIFTCPGQADLLHRNDFNFRHIRRHESKCGMVGVCNPFACNSPFWKMSCDEQYRPIRILHCCLPIVLSLLSVSRWQEEAGAMQGCNKTCKGEVLRVQDDFFHIKCFKCCSKSWFQSLIHAFRSSSNWQLCISHFPVALNDTAKVDLSLCCQFYVFPIELHFKCGSKSWFLITSNPFIPWQLKLAIRYLPFSFSFDWYCKCWCILVLPISYISHGIMHVFTPVLGVK